MATLNEIAYNIKNIARGGITSDDDNLSMRQLKFMIHYHRAGILQKYTNNGRNIHPQSYQSFVGQLTPAGEQELSEYKSHDTDTQHQLLNIDIPEIVQFNGLKGIAFIGLGDRQTPIQLSSAENIFFTQYNRFTNHMRRAFLIGSRLYLYALSTDSINLDINIRAVFSDPTEVIGYLNDDTTQYPFPEELIEPLSMEILTREYGITLNAPVDELNNAKDDKIITTASAQRGKVQKA